MNDAPKPPQDSQDIRPPTVLTWQGQDIDTLTIEELRVAFRGLAEMYQDAEARLRKWSRLP